MPIELEQPIASLVTATDHLLWASYRSAVDGSEPASRFVFPLRLNGKVRVSEQEAKQLFIGRLNFSPYFFSVETPTYGDFGFKGKGRRKAMTDVTLYTSERERMLNVEFKAQNTSVKRQDRLHINKDIKKLVLEDVDGLWFHVLEKANIAGIATLWKTIRHELKAVVQEEVETVPPKRFTFHCCVLREAYSIQTTFLVDESSRNSDWLDCLEPPVVNVKKHRLIDFSDTKGWIVRSDQHQPIVAVTEGV